MVDHGEEQQDPGAQNVAWWELGGLFDSSYARLAPGEARMFRLLGSHPGPAIGAQAVAVLAALEVPSARRFLDRLAEEHLLVKVAPDRFRMHPLVHDYAAHRAHGEEDPAERLDAVTRALEWYAAMADMADRLVLPVTARLAVDLPAVQRPASWDREQALRWLRSERATLSAAQRMAVDEGMHTLVISFAVSSRHLGTGHRSWWPEALAATSRGIEAATVSGDPAAEGFLRVLRGHQHQAVGDLTAAEADFREVLQRAEESRDQVLRRRAVAGLGRLREVQRRYDEAATFYQKMLEATREEGELAAQAVALGNLCRVHVPLGKFDRAWQYGQEALQLRSRTGDRLDVAYANDDLAAVRQATGDHAAAIALWEEVAQVYAQHLGTESHLATTLEAMADSLSAVGRDDEAVTARGRAARIRKDLGDPRADEVQGRADGPASTDAAGSGDS